MDGRTYTSESARARVCDRNRADAEDNGSVQVRGSSTDEEVEEDVGRSIESKSESRKSGGEGSIILRHHESVCHYQPET